MPKLLPIQIPPGFHRNGVEMESMGRWRDGNLVRWEEGSLRPVGGWDTLKRDDGAGGTTDVEVPTGIPRASHGWISNGGQRYIGEATNENLYGAGVTLIFQDLTPAGFVPGLAGENIGYGGKKYGQSSYGTERISDGVTAPISVWTLDNWGEQLLSCTTTDRKLYVWDLITATSVLVANAPPMEAFVITEERFVMALAVDTNLRKVAWCDREDYDTWTPDPLNEAGDIELVTAGALVAGTRVRGRTLLLTTIDAHVATYQGPPIVYGFQRIGTGCGLAAPLTLTSATFGAFWMGVNGFFGYDGSRVMELDCPVLDEVFLNINRNEIRKAFGVANEKRQEVWWFYPSGASTENDKYVAYSYDDDHWLMGTLDRSTGFDAGAYADPIWSRQDGKIYRHETGVSHEGEEPWIESGPIQLGEGDEILYVHRMLQDQALPSEIGTAVLTLDVRTQYFTDGPEYDWGPYSLGFPTDVRFSGRQMFLRLTAEDGAPWRIGGVNLEIEAGGRR